MEYVYSLQNNTLIENNQLWMILYQVKEFTDQSGVERCLGTGD